MVAAILNAKAQFTITARMDKVVQQAISSIPEDAWIHQVTSWLIVRRCIQFRLSRTPCTFDRIAKRPAGVARGATDRRRPAPHPRSPAAKTACDRQVGAEESDTPNRVV